MGSINLRLTDKTEERVRQYIAKHRPGEYRVLSETIETMIKEYLNRHFDS